MALVWAPPTDTQRAHPQVSRDARRDATEAGAAGAKRRGAGEADASRRAALRPIRARASRPVEARRPVGTLRSAAAPHEPGAIEVRGAIGARREPARPGESPAAPSSQARRAVQANEPTDHA